MHLYTKEPFLEIIKYAVHYILYIAVHYIIYKAVYYIKNMAVHFIHLVYIQTIDFIFFLLFQGGFNFQALYNSDFNQNSYN